MSVRCRGHVYWALVLGGVIWFAGCAVGPDYKRPVVVSPSVFRGDGAPTNSSFADLDWWQVYEDTTLQALVREALTNNYDLRIAVTRVEQARAIAAQTRANLFPQFSYEAIVGRGKNAVNNVPTPSRPTGDIFAVAGNASWELDVWGRIR